MALIAPELYDRLVALRRELHQYPELSWQEARTAAVISRFLHDCGIHHRTNIAGHGVVADIPGKTGVPCVVLRADTDALPIQEETGLEFASVHDAVMHACGYDGQTTMLLGWYHPHRGNLRRSLSAVGQTLLCHGDGSECDRGR